MTCPKCATKNAEGVKFCRECGASLDASASPPLQPTPITLESLQATVGPAARSLQAAVGPTARSLRESLARLGVTFSREQLIGFGISLIGGMVVARILPFIYPIFDPILTVVFGSGPSGARDGFNTNMMTFITFFSSFGMSFVTMFITTRKQEQ